MPRHQSGGRKPDEPVASFMLSGAGMHAKRDFPAWVPEQYHVFLAYVEHYDDFPLGCFVNFYFLIFRIIPAVVIK